MPPTSLRPALVLSLVGLAGSLAGCHHAEAPAAAKTSAPPAPIQATLAAVEMRPWRTVVRTQGDLIADEATTVGAKVAGRVASVSVDLGDFVHAGDELAKLEEVELQLQVRTAAAQLAQARAAVGLAVDAADDAVVRERSPVVRQEKAVLDEAKANLARLKLLQERNAVPMADIDTAAAAVGVAEARYASALNAVEEKLALIQVRRAELLLAEDRLRHAVIRAPFDGLVQSKQVAPGTYLSVGNAVATLVRIDPLRYRGTISERQSLQLREGQEVLIYLAGDEAPLTARVSRISPVLDAFSRALSFEADVPNADGRLRSGLFAEAEVVIDSQTEALAVPASAIVEFAGVEKVWRVADGQAEEVSVQTGRRERGLVEIVSGLGAGDSVIRKASEGRRGPVVEVPKTAQAGN